ncbi:MAG: glutamate formimidoyltransferase [Chloroflexi bacterium]|nr:glutamate formimidoyltransferase [Chloroflexota bacterium]
MALVECVPNFSEGRDTETISAIVEAIRSAQVLLLDVSSDHDHHRTVVTFAGEPEAVAEGAFRGIREAARRIDLRAHSGEHPRIGAADVVPFIALRDYSPSQCAALARGVGKRVGDEIGLPVYLYDYAALREDRQTLPQVRRDRFEVLRETILSDPSRQPDYGPAQLGPAGAVAIGAREPLVAFNVFLNTSDLSIAQAIAKQVRESGGGLPKVRALGLFVNGVAQVSLNIVDFRITGLFAALEAVRREAVNFGATVTHTELVGLIPEEALVQAGLAALQLPDSVADLILERRLGAQTGDYRPIPFE